MEVGGLTKGSRPQDSHTSLASRWGWVSPDLPAWGGGLFALNRSQGWGGGPPPSLPQVRSKEKEAAGIAEGRGGARGPENVWGSAATAAACALAAVGFPAQAPLLALGYVASLATKLSDTCGSEIGKAFGKLGRCGAPPKPSRVHGPVLNHPPSNNVLGEYYW